MTGAVLEFLVCCLGVLAAGTLLTRCADLFAERSGLGRVLVGSVFLAAATSLPELSVTVDAARQGAPDLAAGDLLGSSLMNLLILAALDSAGMFTRRAFGSDSRQHSMAGLLAILLTAWIGLGAASGGGRGYFGAGLFSWGVLLVYVLGLRVLWLEREPGEDREELEKASLKLARELALPSLGYAAGVGAMVLIAPRLTSSADAIARLSGLGHTFVGTTGLALATSLPELVATVAAFRMGAPDLALGNIFGSNAFNMVLFLPMDLAYPGSVFAALLPVHALTAFAVVTASTLGVMGQTLKPRERRRFLEPSAELIAILIIALLWMLYHARGVAGALP